MWLDQAVLNEKISRDETEELELLTTKISSTQAALPRFCGEAENLGEMVTILAHGDLSK